MCKTMKWPALFTLAVILLTSCSQPGNKQREQPSGFEDSAAPAMNADTGAASDTGLSGIPDKPAAVKTDKETPVVLVYNFHVTNRCVSCIAIEEATTKTLETYFPLEMKNGRIRRYILNVDDEANREVSEKYQAFGSGLFITRSHKGKEVTADLTAEGFRYARNKEEKFIEILKKNITEYLK